MNSLTIILIVFQLICLQYADLFYAQNKNPDEILKKVKETFSGIEDYKVDVHIKVAVDFLKMPESNATIYFKQPDKVHVESEKFTLLPRRGMNFSPLSILNEKYTAIYVSEDTIRNIRTSVVKVIPLESGSDIVLSTLWIDCTRNIIIKIESTAKPSGTYTLDFFYNESLSGFYMPDSLTFTFTIDKIKMPREMNESIDSDKRRTKDESGRTTGKVFLTYSNYEINKGLPDSLFGEK